MLARLVLGAVVFTSLTASAATPVRAYVVRWAGGDSGEARALVAQLDAKFREALALHGAAVIDAARPGHKAVVLTSRLEVLPGALRLEVVGLRDRAVLGTFSLKASGASRAAQVRALAKQATLEAVQLAGD